MIKALRRENSCHLLFGWQLYNKIKQKPSISDLRSSYNAAKSWSNSILVSGEDEVV